MNSEWTNIPLDFLSSTVPLETVEHAATMPGLALTVKLAAPLNLSRPPPVMVDHGTTTDSLAGELSSMQEDVGDAHSKKRRREEESPFVVVQRQQGDKVDNSDDRIASHMSRANNDRRERSDEDEHGDDYDKDKRNDKSAHFDKARDDQRPDDSPDDSPADQV